MSDYPTDVLKIAKELSSSTNTYAGVLSQLSRSVASFPPVYDSILDQVKRDHRLLSLLSANFDHIKRFAKLSSNIGQLANANSALLCIVQDISSRDSAISRIFEGQQRIYARMKDIAIDPSLISAFARIDTTRILSASLIAQNKVTAFDNLPLGIFAGMEPSISKLLTINFKKLTNSYQFLLNIVSTHKTLSQHVPFITTYAPIEYFREADFLEEITVGGEKTQDDDEIDIIKTFPDSVPSIDELLEAFDKNLFPLLQGARDAATSDNPDRGRHVTTSIRELLTQVLQKLAPDKEIREWSTNKQHFHNNRPVRRARLLYICRHIDVDYFSDFLEADVTAILSFIDTLSKGTHTVKIHFTDPQLLAMVARMEALLVFLLQLRNNANN